MARKTSALKFSVSPAQAREYKRLAERKGKEFVALQQRMARCARKTGVLTEKEVERIVFEDR